jgi:murein DD-endopeptidase MepM/ murein hydrolase activator NlpD
LTYLYPYNDINVYNGDVLSIHSNSKYIIFKNINYYPFIKNNFLIPVHYKSKLITHKLYLFNKEDFININIIDGNYKKDILKVSKNKTNLNNIDYKRAIKEAKTIKDIYKTYIKRQFKDKFIYPLDSKQTSQYGNARVFNNKIKSYHSGLDFRAKIGDRIKASNDGIVAFSGDLFYAGKCVIINHGQRLFTLYAHLSKILVNTNDKVHQKDIIGLSGMTGRVTGPHLHFSTILNSIRINPKSLIYNINNLLDK